MKRKSMNSTWDIKSGINGLIKHIIIVSCIIFFNFCSICHAKDVTLAWDPNPASDNVEYYRIYYDDDTSGPPYDGTGLNLDGINVASGFPLDGGTTVKISGLNDNKIYYFAVTAVDGDGLESDYSNEAQSSIESQASSEPQAAAEPQTTGDSQASGILKISSSTPDGFYKEGDVISIDITFTGVTTLSNDGNIAVSLNCGGIINISAFTDQGVVSAGYTVKSGDNANDLNVTGFTVTSGVLTSDGIDVPVVLPAGNNLADNKDILVDGTPPSSTVSAPSSGDGELSISWVASDNSSGVASTKLWYAKPATPEPLWSDTGLSPQTGSSGAFHFTPPDGAGTYLFASRSTDNAGNLEDLPSGNNSDDTTAYMMSPKITTEDGQDYSTGISTITLEGTANSQTAEIRVNDVLINYTPGASTWSYAIDLSPGSNYIEVVAVDTYGNVSSADTITVTYDTTKATPPVIPSGDVIPCNDAGILDNTRVPDNTSFGVRLKDSDGINLTDPDSVEFTVRYSGNEYTVNTGDSDVLKYVILSGTSADATDVWVVYHKAKDKINGTSYEYGATVTVDVMARDVYGYAMKSPASYRFKVETSVQNTEAAIESPGIVPVSSGFSESYDSGIEVTDGVFKGIKILFNSVEDVTPVVGPDGELPELDYPGSEPVGAPLNLQPPTVFSIPAKLFIPCENVTDVSGLSVFLYDGVEWVSACDKDGNVLAGGDGWMVPGSRVNHNSSDPDTTPSTIEIKVYHFSGVVTGSISSGVASADSNSGNSNISSSNISDSSNIDGDGGGGGGCFIATAYEVIHTNVSEKTVGFLLFGLIMMFGLSRLKNRKAGGIKTEKMNREGREER